MPEPSVLIHLDTDLGSDTDDACALAMLLGWPGVEIAGITTTIDPGGVRAGMVTRCLELAGRTDIPVAAGAEVSLTTRQTPGGIPEDARYWPEPVAPRPSRMGDAMVLLRESVEAGATIVAIGPYTNLATLEAIMSGSLGRVPVVLMGGIVRAAGAGLPAWGPEMDWNVQCDTNAAEVVFANTTRLTMVTVPTAFKAHLRAAHLPRLRNAGGLGALLAAQAEAHAADNGMTELGRAHRALPDDLLNFQYDAVACAVAAEWPGAVVEEFRLAAVLEHDVLRFEPSETGRATNVVVDIDSADFDDRWFESVERISRSSESRASP
jgi:inosine-uridine nucleoside N-ribohydrolase